MRNFYLQVALLCLCSTGFGQQAPWFNNEPSLNFDVHDPTVIRDEEGRYTLMSTNNLLELRQTDNLLNWSYSGRVFNAVPGWAQQEISNVEDLWAPHIVYMGGRYYAYYSASSFGSNDSGIGCASTSTLDTDNPDYGWTDHGIVILSQGQNFNAIDPEIIQDQNGNWWMLFGSFWPTGIRMVQINPNTGKRTSENNTIYALADRNNTSGIEGPSMMYHDGYYYLFVAYDACCQGVNSTYRTMVGRSQNITGPYVDKKGNDMRNNAASEVLSAYDSYFGTAHGSVYKDNQRDYFVHHYYDGDRNGFPAPHFREIIWGADGWPILSQPYIGRRQAYEAEHAKVVNVQYNDGNNASNGSYLGNINFADSRVIFHIRALQAGTYKVRIRYAAGGGDASHILSVNGTEQTINYPGTSNWGQFPQGQTVTVEVNLNEGYNNLTFRVGTGFAELDRIDLFRIADQVIEAGAIDDGVGVDFDGNNALLSSGSWSKFEYVDFEGGGYANLNVTASGTCNGTLDFSIDGVNASTNVQANVNLAAGQTQSISLPGAFSSLTNTHDVYYEFTGNQACALDQIQFTDGSTPVEDCNGDVGGSAYLDGCGQCVGGNTGQQPCATTSGNPFIDPVETGRFSADPAALVHDGRVYVYVGRDEAQPNADDFVLNRWDVYSTCDMVNWQHEGSPLSIDSFDWAWAAAFAGQCVERDGKFYWYVPMLGRNDQGAGPYFSIGVAVADSPTGPFTDALGEPLIFDSTTPDVWFDIDPSVFVDDDGQAYIYWGNVTQGDQPNLSPMKMARLNDDMTSIEPGSIQTVTLGNGNALPGWVEAPYMHKKGDTYYLSYARYYPEQIVYCTGPSPEGPWMFRGLLNDYVNSETNHQSIIEYKGQDYFIYHNYYPELGGDDFRRSVSIEEMYYNADGTIQEIIQTSEGASAVPCTLPDVVEEGYYKIYPVHSGLCMESNNPATQETCVEANVQYWQVIKDGDNYQIVSLATGEYLSPGSGVQGENTEMSATPVSLSLSSAGNGNVYISPIDNSDLVFDILNVSQEEGMPTILWVNTGADNQRFTFEPVDLPTDCNGDVLGTAEVDACGICAGGNTGVTACAGNIEAESACAYDGSIDDNNAGFSGTGFVNTTNATGTTITLSLSAASAQNVTLRFVYANGGTADRPATVTVNGNAVGTLDLSPTGAWTTWETEILTLDLESGNNVIVLTATTANGIANLDQLIVYDEEISLGSCATDCNDDIGGIATVDACGKCTGGNTGASSDDADADGILDCNDSYPYDYDNDGVTTTDDCDDTNPDLGPPSTWYADTDADGVGDASNAVQACTQPQGYVATLGDECPNDQRKILPGECGCGNTEQSCLDCNSDPNGSAYIDECENCVGGNTGNEACTQDCYGDWGGTAALDACDQCAGGNTGIVPVTDSQNCIATSIDDYEAQFNLVYPNPTSGQLHLKETTFWILLDMTGVELQRGVTNSISLEAYRPGIYFLQVHDEMIKVVKE